MARSSLVIGLGGTGQWIVTYLKKDLLESNNGVMPPNVRLLSFDTMLEQEASVAQMGDDEDIKVGDVQLDFGTEFIPLADDVRELAEQIKKGKHHQIGIWFAAKRWLEILTEANFILKTGAGQLRQFGRLTVFNDLIKGKNNSVIWRAITNALGSIGAVAGKQTIEVFIISSFAGGTGSGMFIDMGWIVRQAAKRQSITVRGYSVLPGAFTTKGQDQAMLARSFAAWRELNRFMTLNDDEGLRKLVFDPNENEFQIDLGRKVFDACYLIDAVRGQSEITEDAKKSIYPTVSDAISAVLDDRGGARYSDYVVTNLASKYAENPGNPMYSTLSTYSYKVPVYYLRQEFAHVFSKHFLETLLGLTQPSGGGNFILANYDTERGNKIGFNSALELFTQETQRYGVGENEEVAYANLFTQKIAEIAAGGGIRSAELLQNQTNAFLSRAGLEHSWVTPLTDFGDDPAATELKKEANAAVQFTLKSVIDATPQATGGGFLGRGKEKPKEVIGRIKPRIDGYMWEYYGGQVATGGEFTGKLGDALDRVQAYQVDNFRRLVRIWVLRTLMGDSQTDFVKARGGKLGYAISFMEGIVSYLDEALTFLERVQTMVTEQKPALALQQRRAGRETKMVKEADRKMLWWVHPQAYNNIESYLRAAQNVAFSRREAITHRTVVETIELMEQYAVLVKDELERWARLLFDGNASIGLPGLYTEIEKNLRSVQATHKADQNLEKAQTLLLDEVPSVPKEELQAMMRGVLWSAEAGSNSFHLSLEIEPEGDKKLSFQQLGSRTTRSAASSLTQRNLGEILGMGIQRYPLGLNNEQQVSAILQLHKPEAGILADELIAGYDHTLIERQSGERGPLVRSNFVRVQIGKDADSVDYFNELESRLRDRSQTTGQKRDASFLVEVVDSADQYKLTMVRTDDLWPYLSFSRWHECFEAYQNEIKRPNQSSVQYHVYAPEIKAVTYELKLETDLRTEYRAFHPRVVHLLEYSNRLEQFFLGWALGFFQQMGDSINETWWELAVPGSRYRLQLTKHWRREPDDFIFALMNSYILVGRDLTPGVKDRVNYAQVRESIKEARVSLGKEGMLEKIKFQLLDRDGLMNLLMNRAGVKQVEMASGDFREEVNNPEFLDLRDLGRLIYHEELRALGYSLLDIEEGRI